MGLSASQARLLNLTSRMHDIEYKAQKLEAQKLQMANESDHVYSTYEDALNRQKIQFKQIDTDGSAKYEDASVATLIAAGYHIKILNGNDWYDYTGGTNGIDSTTGKSKYSSDWILFNTTSEEITITATGSSYGAGAFVMLYTPTHTGIQCKLAQNLDKSATTAVVYKKATQDTTKQASLANINLNDTTVLQNLVEAGFIVFEKPTTSNGVTSYTEVNVATDTNLQETSDDVELKKAEATYEADMRKIDAKDKKYDTELASLEQERNAIKTEIDTLGNVAKDNVDRTFKLFS